MGAGCTRQECSWSTSGQAPQQGQAQLVISLVVTAITAFFLAWCVVCIIRRQTAKWAKLAKGRDACEMSNNLKQLG